MVLLPVYLFTAIIAVISLILVPINLSTDSLLRFIAVASPIPIFHMLCSRIPPELPAGPNEPYYTQKSTYRRIDNNKIHVKSNFPITTDTVLGNQEPAWKPITESSETTADKDDHEEPYYSETFSDANLETGSFPYLEYLQTMLASIRFLAINAWHDPRVFVQPKPSLVPDTENEHTNQLKSDHNNKPEILVGSAESLEESESLKRICEVLLLSGIEYDACNSLSNMVKEDESLAKIAATPWSDADDNSIRWKEVKQGKDFIRNTV